MRRDLVVENIDLFCSADSRSFVKIAILLNDLPTRILINVRNIALFNCSTSYAIDNLGNSWYTESSAFTQRNLMFYLITISAASLLITFINFLADGQYTLVAFAYLLLITLLGVAAVFLVDAIAATVARRLPERWFAPEARLFSVGKWERNLYRKSKISVWKKYVPEWGCFTGFHKDKMRDPNNSSYVGRFLLESNYGVAGHIAGAVLGFLIMLLPFLRPFAIAFPVAAVNFVLSMLPTLVLRANTPALRGLYRRNLTRETRDSEKSISEAIKK